MRRMKTARPEMRIGLRMRRGTGRSERSRAPGSGKLAVNARVLRAGPAPLLLPASVALVAAGLLRTFPLAISREFSIVTRGPRGGRLRQNFLRLP